MTTTPNIAADAVPVGELFLAHLPRVRAHARYALRHVRCPETRADLVAEVIGLAWKHFVTLVRRGKRPEKFVTVLALRCSQAVRAGRRLAGCENARDVFSPVARVRHGFEVGRLAGVVRPNDELAEALAENTRTRVPDQVSFRVDFPRWRAGLGDRDRAVLDALMAGDGTGAVAVRFGVSKARVSQLRREFERSWRAFTRG